jgi:F0F1-type ATP synthase membrane subunit b/b'
MLHALGGILLRAVPTFLLVIALNYYLKSVFFKPLEKVLHLRHEATEGARKTAEESLARAEAKTAQYEAAIREAANSIYQAQEKSHKDMQDREAAVVAQARHASEAAVKQAKADLAADVAAAKTALAGEADAMANRIADSILRSTAA